jgi:hypothetical protein
MERAAMSVEKFMSSERSGNGPKGVVIGPRSFPGSVAPADPRDAKSQCQSKIDRLKEEDRVE